MSGCKTKLIVAAIDFGTTYSGYAWSFTDDYHNDHMKIYTYTNWTDGSGLLTLKTPTVVLFDPNGKFDSFGYEAENKYAKLSSNDKHTGWKCFRRFKMALHSTKKLRRNFKLVDDQGQTMPAVEVFSASIKYLKDHLMKQLSERLGEFHETDIDWVVTVPAIWEDEGKQFMHETSEKAGIPKDQFQLALEPEAAALYCNTLAAVAKAKEERKETRLKTFNIGDQFMLLDLGGGTVDITVHEVLKDGTLKELCPPSGGPWGGTRVDAHILQLLDQLFGEDVMQKFRTECKSEELDLLRAIELRKRMFKTDDLASGTVSLTVSSALFEIFNESKDPKVNFDLIVEHSIFAKTIKRKRGKLEICPELFLRCFDESASQLLAHLKWLMLTPELRNVTTIVMVGGFSGSEIMARAVKKEFNHLKTIIAPEHVDLAVVKGAVMFGLDKYAISSRILRHSYGVSTAVPFNPEIHDVRNRHNRGGHIKCENIFKVFLRAGTTFIPNQTKVKQKISATMGWNSEECIEIYRSISKTPRYVTDPDCQKVGQMIIKLENKLNNQHRDLDIIMWIDTSLHVECYEHGTKNKNHAQFDFL